MSKILRVNMTDLTTQFESVPEKYKTMGGRWLTWRQVPSNRHHQGDQLRRYGRSEARPFGHQGHRCRGAAQGKGPVLGP